ncbi:aminoglycoside phosphotransferase family protein [Tenggerimyces flavus]|uniref:Aminoglycoside phosphotransferase family protein n=1 Tax=Tenggerimyces flavus TaxID=1708749 RepID=A0ABV7YC58_9ACTN|nr:aminoglycoside phosphotransferase family protein [Tenggerimyces flavus]MBM7783415.1 streptomycin 6-kinase [Tenggerimyces flavus]
MIEVPESFVSAVISREGEAGRTWLAALPELVADLLDRWRCIPTTPITRGGVGVILPVKRFDDSPAVLKVSFPHPGNRYEADAFATWGGRGAVLLYERDDANFAMLLEQGEWETLDAAGDVDNQTALIGQLARRLAVPAPPHLPRLAERAPEWEDALRTDDAQLGQPLSKRALDAALATVRELGSKQPDTMVHGDLHFGNVVRAQREPWLAIDPKGWAGDLAVDAFKVLVGGRHSLFAAPDLRAELLRRLAIFADAAEVERERAVRWAQYDAVSGAHYSRRAGDPAETVGAYEAVAELLS